LTRSFSGFSQAATENGESRIYAGIQFRSAVEDGIKQGNQIGNFVFTHAFHQWEANLGILGVTEKINLASYGRQKHCRGLYQTPIAA